MIESALPSTFLHELCKNRGGEGGYVGEDCSKYLAYPFCKTKKYALFKYVHSKYRQVKEDKKQL